MERELREIRALPEVEPVRASLERKSAKGTVPLPPPMTERERRNLEFERLYVQRDHLIALRVPQARIQPILRRIYDLNREEQRELDGNA